MADDIDDIVSEQMATLPDRPTVSWVLVEDAIRAAVLADRERHPAAERVKALEAAIGALADEFEHSSDLWHDAAGHPYDRAQAAEGAAKFVVYDEASKKLRAALEGR